MKRDEIIRMAREAGINFDPAGPGDDGIDTWYGDQYLPCGSIAKLIEIAQSAEREACAKVAASYRMIGAGTIAAAIRAREGHSQAVETP